MFTTTTPGSSPSYGEEIKTYPEHLEREVSNIIGRNSEKVSLPERETTWVIKDISALTIELMEYILDNYEMGRKPRRLP